MKRLVDVLLLGALVAIVVPGGLEACAPAYRPGSPPVYITRESALILYDSKTKTEHFIRRGTFDTAAPDFAFLVPTPTEPKLDEVDQSIFDRLEDWSKPEVKVVSRPRDRHSRGGKAMMFAGGAPGAPAVAVLGRQRVAGLDAVSLKATNTKELQDWLNKHGYATRPVLDTWLDRYVKDGWVITAFKLAQEGPGASGLSTKALRMSFETDKPFYPYREPEDMRSFGRHPGGRLLRVFYVGDARMEGVLGEKGEPWVGRAAWANPIEASQRKQVLDAGSLGDATLPKDVWLTVFDDDSSPRNGTEELYFRRSADQSGLKRPERVEYVEVDPPPSPLAETLAEGHRWVPLVAVAGAVAVFALILLTWVVVGRRASAQGRGEEL